MSDREVSSRKALRSLFEQIRENAVCIEAVNGADAVHKARHHPSKVIIPDFVMSEMNGLQAARIIKQFHA